MKKFRTLTLVAATLGLTCGAVANVAADGGALYQAKLCHTCHGPDGNTPIMPVYPKIAGQNKEYLVQQMKDIRDGARSNGLSAAMKPMVANVSDEEMEEIAAWLAAK